MFIAPSPISAFGCLASSSLAISAQGRRPGAGVGVPDRPGRIGRRCAPSLNRLLFRYLQKTLVVDDALTGVHATHEVSERGIVYFESVTENASRCGIDGTFDLATLTAHRYRLSKAIEAKIRTLGRIQKRKALEEFLFRNDSAVFYVSGGHFNPAVTVGLCTARRFLGRDVIPYVLAQVAGAIAGAGILYFIASGKTGFDASAGFAANGYDVYSPGGYSLTAALVAD